MATIRTTTKERDGVYTISHKRTARLGVVSLNAAMTAARRDGCKVYDCTSMAEDGRIYQGYTHGNLRLALDRAAQFVARGVAGIPY